MGKRQAKRAVANPARTEGATENQHALLEEAIFNHLDRNGNDVEKGLAAVCLTGPVREDLDKISDPDLQAGLAGVPEMPAVVMDKVKPKPAKPAAPPPMPKPTTQQTTPAAPPAAKPTGVSTWVWLAGCAALGVVLVAVASTAVLAVILVMMLVAKPDGKQPDPIVQAKPDPVKPPEKKPKPAEEPKDPEDPILVLPPKDPNDPVKPLPVPPPMPEPMDPPMNPDPPMPPPIVKNKLAPDFIVEIPRPAGRSLLSADGKYVAYTLAAGKFGYREGPAFGVGKEVAFADAQTAIHPLASIARRAQDGVYPRELAKGRWSTCGIGRQGQSKKPSPSRISHMPVRSRRTAISLHASGTDRSQQAPGILAAPARPPHGPDRHQWKLDDEANFFGFTPRQRKSIRRGQEVAAGERMERQQWRTQRHCVSAARHALFVLARLQ